MNYKKTQSLERQDGELEFEEVNKKGKIIMTKADSSDYDSEDEVEKIPNLLVLKP